ncbi:hypothetical protein FPFC_022230 [Fructobacillus pseudoficulneus]|uniref:Uncharacterized protein n=1 Tax=Fructobacillus pseudoficulneus TaxID=220714 RepID=A0A3F3H8Y1_9LACO|nr:hypothetical protein [Fructobacillus pseudoficulneus]GAP02773.1 hypothetical protein FPFC_022230 [Fructobacillus pseudoficulneus]SEH39793.1 hypothetical protein SAMN05660469_0712 [Fructobacillus pseudoficulneus]
MTPEKYFEEFTDNDQLIEEIKNIQKFREERAKDSFGFLPRPDFFAGKYPVTDAEIRAILAVAKKILVDRGGAYPLSQVELLDELFQQKVPLISKIQVEAFGYFAGLRRDTFKIQGEDVLAKTEYRSMAELASRIQREETDQRVMGKDEFLEKIRKMHLGEWRFYYTQPEIMDGTQWSIDVYFNQGEDVINYHGSNAYPSNIAEFSKFLSLDLGV